MRPQLASEAPPRRGTRPSSRVRGVSLTVSRASCRPHRSAPRAPARDRAGDRWAPAQSARAPLLQRRAAPPAIPRATCSARTGKTPTAAWRRQLARLRHDLHRGVERVGRLKDPILARCDRGRDGSSLILGDLPVPLSAPARPRARYVTSVPCSLRRTIVASMPSVMMSRLDPSAATPRRTSRSPASTFAASSSSRTRVTSTSPWQSTSAAPPPSGPPPPSSRAASAIRA